MATHFPQNPCADSIYPEDFADVFFDPEGDVNNVILDL